MTQIGFGIVIDETEDNEYGLLQRIRLLDSVLEGVITLGALRLLHPVQYLVPGARG